MATRRPPSGKSARRKSAPPARARVSALAAKTAQSTKATKATKAARATKTTKATSAPVAARKRRPGSASATSHAPPVTPPAGPVREPAPPAHLPWSYGLDRITATAVDPDRLYVYWECTDGAIDRARAALGPGGAGAWLDLRVHDTSGRVFDGTNAHSWFDQGVDRATRQWFFQIGKPSSSAIVELGLRTGEGHFARIARSGRVDFPRREPAAWREAEWMTVQPWSGAVAEVHRGGAAGPGRSPAPASAPPRFEQIPLWTMHEVGEGHDALLRQALEHGWERLEWQESSGGGWFALEGRTEWESPHVVTSWEAGPFAYPVEVLPPSREAWAGRTFAWRVGGVTHVVYGPWRVVIRNLGRHAERAVHGAWTIVRSWAVEGGHALRAGPDRVPRPGASERLLLGASERRWLAASELRLGGASEVWRLGASEVAYRGASERFYLGASQWRARGASERRLGGASERRLGGASERWYGAGSERRLGGASERLHAGGSEQRLGPEPGEELPYPAPPGPRGEE